ncbi:hypothetical protein EXVG_00262 [Emiliania huxleyi virus 202]|nr:hypothetical protein EXVG_00262 [Emiliania huxleyi virus 202]
MRFWAFAYDKMRKYISQMTCISYINTKHSSVGLEHRQPPSGCRIEPSGCHRRPAGGIERDRGLCVDLFPSSNLVRKEVL